MPVMVTVMYHNGSRDYNRVNNCSSKSNRNSMPMAVMMMTMAVVVVSHCYSCGSSMLKIEVGFFSFCLRKWVVFFLANSICILSVSVYPVLYFIASRDGKLKAMQWNEIDISSDDVSFFDSIGMPAEKRYWEGYCHPWKLKSSTATLDIKKELTHLLLLFDCWLIISKQLPLFHCIGLNNNTMELIYDTHITYFRNCVVYLCSWAALHQRNLGSRPYLTISFALELPLILLFWKRSNDALDIEFLHPNQENARKSHWNETKEYTCVVEEE